MVDCKFPGEGSTFNLLARRTPPISLRLVMGLYVIRLSDGKLIESFSNEQLARRISAEWGSPDCLAAMPATSQLLVAFTGENCHLFDSGMKAIDSLKTEQYVRQLSTDPTGRFVLTVSQKDNIHIWDMQARKEIFKTRQEQEAGDRRAVHQLRVFRWQEHARLYCRRQLGNRPAFAFTTLLRTRR